MPSIDRLAMDELGRRQREVGREPLAQLAREVGHRGEVGRRRGDRSTEDLARAEALVSRASSAASSAGRSSSTSWRVAASEGTVSLTVPTTWQIFDLITKLPRRRRRPLARIGNAHVIVGDSAGNPFSVNALRHISAPLSTHAFPAASFTLSNSPIVRDVLDNGLRILTERMTTGPLDQHRRLADARLAPRERRARRHRAFRRAHALQGDGDAGRPRTSRRRSIRSAASSTRSRRRNTRATTSRCSTSICRSRSTSSPTSSAIRRSASTTSSARRRSSSKRSRWSRTRPTISSTSSSRRASGRTIRSAGRFSARARPSSRSTPTCCATTSARRTRRGT